MAVKVAIVTGANKGIGFAIVRGLCKRFDGDVYLTSRDVARGRDAVEKLVKEGLNPKFHQLDITDKQSLETLRDFLQKNYDGIDVLVNNAAMAFKQDAIEPISVQAQQTLFVNYFSLVTTCETLIPLLKPGARVVNVSSSSGHLSKIPSYTLRQKLADHKLTISELSELMQSYINNVRDGTHAAEWGTSSYVVSKVGVTALTRIHQILLSDKNIKVNAVHPGYVDTDMTSHKGVFTIERGAEAPLYLALDAPDSIKGQFVWHNKEIISWEGESQWRLLTKELLAIFIAIAFNFPSYVRRQLSRIPTFFNRG